MLNRLMNSSSSWKILSCLTRSSSTKNQFYIGDVLCVLASRHYLTSIAEKIADDLVAHILSQKKNQSIVSLLSPSLRTDICRQYLYDLFPELKKLKFDPNEIFGCSSPSIYVQGLWLHDIEKKFGKFVTIKPLLEPGESTARPTLAASTLARIVTLMKDDAKWTKIIFLIALALTTYGVYDSYHNNNIIKIAADVKKRLFTLWGYTSDKNHADIDFDQNLDLDANQSANIRINP